MCSAFFTEYVNIVEFVRSDLWIMLTTHIQHTDEKYSWYVAQSTDIT